MFDMKARKTGAERWGILTVVVQKCRRSGERGHDEVILGVLPRHDDDLHAGMNYIYPVTFSEPSALACVLIHQ